MAVSRTVCFALDTMRVNVMLVLVILVDHLFVQSIPIWALAGSWPVLPPGVLAARFKRPGVYSNVAEFSDWIGSIIRQYPSVVGQCKTKGNGYGYDGDWSWTGQAPPRKPQSQLFFSNGNSFGADGASVKPQQPVATKPAATQPPKPFFPATAPPAPAPVDPFAVAADGEKGANKCAGLSGKQLKKCKKGGGKPAKQDKKSKKEGKAAKKQAKKEKKEKKKNKSMEFESMGLSKKEIKKLKKQAAEEEATRSDGVSFDSADAVEDDNQMFAGWDYSK